MEHPLPAQKQNNEWGAHCLAARGGGTKTRHDCSQRVRHVRMPVVLMKHAVRVTGGVEERSVAGLRVYACKLSFGCKKQETRGAALTFEDDGLG